MQRAFLSVRLVQSDADWSRYALAGIVIREGDIEMMTSRVLDVGDGRDIA